MLQMKKAALKALENLRSAGEIPFVWQSMEELETKTNAFVSHFLDERLKVSKELGGGFFLPELLDRLMRTSESENMDDRELPEIEKLELVKALDRQNEMLHLYPRYVAMLLSLLDETVKGGEPEARVLELASGSGGLAIALAEEVKRKNLAVSVTGSDIIPIFIEEGNRLAAEKKLPLRFRQLNAYDLSELSAGSFDLMVLF